MVNGKECADGWGQRLAGDQLVLSLEDADGEMHSRIPYGPIGDGFGDGVRICHDCAANPGQFHALGCDMERCPICGGQLISCSCDFA